MTKTIPERVFQVKDAGGRAYRVTRYAWLDNVAAEGRPEEWKETWHLLMTENGGFLDPVGEGRYVVDGTGTVVESVD
ncbi:hypothetical protein H6CHR_03728 [Variovorax sp. PBL-H6]|uniref:hypothetical protein n=1 Tax=Variovorax sp. PBL-H6 TaxID=434009 RepID=UPI001316EF7D|nr:hypothetical protein [Variovorax sp. PBL-H6]VTU32075.1 hypothetical protein H6CHR_03728 [Variovorax sp. PBL-H6]